jgi:predicted HAD superfamily Cof-like phosphohydrolase
MERAFVRLALEMLVSLEALPEEQIELRTAVQLEEDIADVVCSLSAEDRQIFVQAAETLAEEADQAGWGRGTLIREALAALELDEPE